MFDPITVFISSTCYDLIDVRHSLQVDLESKGFIVKMSDRYDTDFLVGDHQDSIETCLANLRSADVVLCIIDRRYGPLIDCYDNRSATHVEVLEAIKLQIPTMNFIRTRSDSELRAMCRDTDLKCKWLQVEPKNLPLRRRFCELYQLVSDLNQSRAADLEHNNWFDNFETIVDLKEIVCARLLRRFQQSTAILAMRPDRLVRLNFIPAGGQTDMNEVRGHFRNSTMQAAFNLIYGCRSDADEWGIQERGVLGHAENASGELKNVRFPFTHSSHYKAIFCEYENAFGDRYRVEIPLVEQIRNMPAPAISMGMQSYTAPTVPSTISQAFFRLGSEKLFVQVGKGSDQQWFRVATQPMSRPPLPPPE